MVLLDVFIAQLVLSLERLDDAVGLIRHNVTPVNNLLAFLYHSAGQRYACQQVVLAGFAAFAVVDQVGGDIFIKVTFLQNRAYGNQYLILE